MKQKRKPPKLTKPLQMKFYGNKEMYELNAREAYGREGIQKVFEEKMFGPKWRERLEELRRQQRSRGIPDVIFYHPRSLAELGLKKRRNKIPEGKKE